MGVREEGGGCFRVMLYCDNPFLEDLNYATTYTLTQPAKSL
jgi:hypothetical protein